MLEVFEHAADDDQPVKCPYCGARTDWEDNLDGGQLHVCYGVGAHTFIVVFEGEE